VALVDSLQFKILAQQVVQVVLAVVLGQTADQLQQVGPLEQAEQILLTSLAVWAPQLSLPCLFQARPAQEQLPQMRQLAEALTLEVAVELRLYLEMVDLPTTWVVAVEGHLLALEQHSWVGTVLTAHYSYYYHRKERKNGRNSKNLCHY
jgi:hypothetical protein